MRHSLTAAAIAAACLYAAPATAVPAAYDLPVAKSYVALAYASACKGADIKNWSCSWCKTFSGSKIGKSLPFAGFKLDTYVEDPRQGKKGTDGAALTGFVPANAMARFNGQIFLSYRSTVLWSWQSVMVDFSFAKAGFATADGTVRGQVHDGFQNAYKVLNDLGIKASLDKLMRQMPRAEVVFIGHSLGGALVTMAAADFASRYPDRAFTVYSYGSPRVGDKIFAEWFATLSNVKFERATTADDPVPHAPRLSQGFVHVDSAQERWFKTVKDAQNENAPKTCPVGENGDCSNTQKGATNFAGAHALYVGYKFDQCGAPTAWLNDIKDWTKKGLGKIEDKFVAAEHGAGVLARKAAAKAQQLKDEAAAKAKQLEDAAAARLAAEQQRLAAEAAAEKRKLEGAGSKVVDTGKKVGGKVSGGAKKLGGMLGL